MAASINLALESVTISQQQVVPTSRASANVPGKINSGVYMSSISSESSATRINDRSVEPTKSKELSRNRFVDNSVHQYKVIKTIGEGRYAKVKLVEEISSGKKLAIKIINTADLDAIRRKRLVREIKIMKRLHHQNVVQLLEAFETDKAHYLVMEYLPKGDLCDYTNTYHQNKLHDKEARAIFRQIVSAVDYCHQRGIMHRHLKLENIFVDSEMNIKIGGFGKSTDFFPDKKLTTYCGTPAYHAPEILLGKKYGIEVDVWSLGVILYILVTGCAPFDDSTLELLTKQVLLCNYKIPDYVSTTCKALIRKILVFKPAERATLKSIMEDGWINIGYADNKLKPCTENRDEG